MRRQIKRLELMMGLVLIATAGILARHSAVTVMQQRELQEKETLVVVIDAGHGGDDPGKVGVNDAQEKEINLLIAQKLKILFESQEIEVVMTRESDAGLYEESAQNHKVQDMQRRCQLIEDEGADLVVSIHQNSYTQESIKGAQVFYYGQSAEGETLANSIQASLIERLDPENTRVAKANESYYLLKKTSVPTVIVECGFLSNWEEAEQLITEAYQEKVAWAVYMGVMEYINTGESDT